MIAAKKADFAKIAEEFNISPVAARLLRNRDLIEEEEIRRYLYGKLSDLHDPLLMKDMEKAAELLLFKIRQKAAIRVIGDYDVDGICSAFILWKGITALGGKADKVIPHRIKDGYGLNQELITAAKQEEIDTIVTCDNGIAAAPQIDHAKELGMTVIVTDHHEVPFEGEGEMRRYLLPQADAVVDPKQPDCTYPFPHICGAVVAYKLVQTLVEKEQETSETEGKLLKGLLTELLPFAALATVCDVMELKGENRILVKHGLAAMSQTENIGLKALLQVTGIDKKPLTPYHAGFILGPCLNATGRLDTATRALQLFEAQDWREAVTIAADLKSLNDSRKQMTEEGVKAAIQQVEETGLIQDKVLVIYLPECHESLAGIIAGRIRERYGKPAFVLTMSEEGIKGSGRSIEAYSMYEEITACKDLFTKYGGHKMAAGLSLMGKEQVTELRRRLNESCKLTQEDFEETVHIDVALPLACADRKLIQELSLLEPFGVGNPKPLFARKGISLLRGRKLGKNKNVGKYQIADEKGAVYDMVYFGDLEELDRFLAERFGQETAEQLYQGGLGVGSAPVSMAYYPDIDSYGGREKVQLIMQYYC